MTRPVEVNIKNNDGDTIMKLTKECNLALMGIFCLPQMNLYDKENDKELGYIRVNCSVCNMNPCQTYPNFSIFDEDGDIRFLTTSPCCSLPNCCSISLAECERQYVLPI